MTPQALPYGASTQRNSPLPEPPAPNGRPAEGQPSPADASEARGGLLDGMKGWLSDVVRDPGAALKGAEEKIRQTVMDKTGLSPTKDEMAAMKTVHDMLSADKLGGKDGTFNQNDTDAIAQSIGKNMGGIKGRIASRIAGKQINEGLQKEHISPERAEPDATPRNVTREDMEGFQKAVATGLQGYSKRVGQTPLGKALGLDKPAHPPHGLSQNDVKAIMEGRKPQGWVEDH